jgi:hypothetical protein
MIERKNPTHNHSVNLTCGMKPRQAGYLHR